VSFASNRSWMIEAKQKRRRFRWCVFFVTVILAFDLKRCRWDIDDGRTSTVCLLLLHFWMYFRTNIARIILFIMSQPSSYGIYLSVARDRFVTDFLIRMRSWQRKV
jgi:hypothetical protein